MDLFKDSLLVKKRARLGFVVLLIFLALFMLWTLFAPLESASVAEGTVVVKTSRKTIQHLEGGIIKKLYVTEGSVVKQNDILLDLENIQAKASYDLTHAQVMTLLANNARLIATLHQKDKIEWPALLLDHQHEEVVKKAIALQTELFTSDRNSLDGQIDILNSRVKQSDNEIQALKEQIKSKSRQLSLINEEIKAVAYLEAKRLIDKPRLWALQREEAKLQGDIGDAEQQIAKAQEQISETKQRIITLRDTTQKDNNKELYENQAKLSDVLERRKNSEDILKRTIIRSPQSGSVVNLAYHTIGGVVKPGEPIMDIVPNQDELIVEALVKPIDIASVHAGLVARVQLIALNQRITPVVKGVVTMVSADAFTEPKTNQSFYRIKVRIDPDQLKNIPSASLYPGMPVTVLVITGKRSLFFYLFSPLFDGFKKAFREI